MRLGWRVGLPGPFSLSGTIWRSKRRHHSYARRQPLAVRYPHEGCPVQHLSYRTAWECWQKTNKDWLAIGPWE